ncbi:hypothetical protein KAT51_03690 [bacterium]|nr:hypothetical protein [bacterium]
MTKKLVILVVILLVVISGTMYLKGKKAGRQLALVPEEIVTPEETVVPEVMITPEEIALPKETESVKLEYKYKKGDIVKYKLTSFVTTEMETVPGAEKSEHKVNLLLIQKITNVSSDGLINMELILDKGFIEQFGIKKSYPSGTSVSAKMLKNGQFLAGGGWDELADKLIVQEVDFGKPTQQLSGSLPEREVKVGNSWVQKIKVFPFGMSPTIVEIRHTLVGFENVKGFNCAKIKSNYTVPLAGKAKSKLEDREIISMLKGKSTIEIVTYFAYQEGRDVRTETNSNIVMTIITEGIPEMEVKTSSVGILALL